MVSAFDVRRLPTIGRVVEVGEILATLQSYRGDPVTITSPELVRPKGCEMVSELFRMLNVRRRDLVYQVPLLPNRARKLVRHKEVRLLKLEGLHRVTSYQGEVDNAERSDELERWDACCLNMSRQGGRFQEC